MRKLLITLVAVAGLAVAAHVNEEKPIGTPDGVLSTFTLAQSPIASSVSVHVNGLLNYQGVDYDVTLGQIVFRPASIPKAGWELRVSYDPVPPLVGILIDAGGPGDQYFSPADRVPCANGFTCAFTDQAMGPSTYATIRYGFGMLPFKYDIPAPNGSCAVTLGFSEPNKTAPGQRVFTIVANDQTVADVDVFARAGGAKIPTTLQLTIAVTDGFLHFTFTPKPNTWNAFVSSIAAACSPNS